MIPKAEHLARRVDDLTYYGQFVTSRVIDATVRKMGSQALFASRGFPFDDMRRGCWAKVPVFVLLPDELGDAFKASGEAMETWTAGVAKAAAHAWKSGGHRWSADSQSFV